MSYFILLVEDEGFSGDEYDSVPVHHDAKTWLEDTCIVRGQIDSFSKVIGAIPCSDKLAKEIQSRNGFEMLEP